MTIVYSFPHKYSSPPVRLYYLPITCFWLFYCFKLRRCSCFYLHSYRDLYNRIQLHLPYEELPSLQPSDPACAVTGLYSGPARPAHCWTPFPLGLLDLGQYAKVYPTAHDGQRHCLSRLVPVAYGASRSRLLPEG